MTSLPPEVSANLALYADGPRLLREAVAGLNDAQLRRPAPPGKWSVLEVVAHLADFEIVFADRLTRVLAEDRPALPTGDENLYAVRLAYGSRNLMLELDLIESLRRHTAAILATAGAADFERCGIHSADGPLTLAELLRRIANHLPHHVRFIHEKRPALLAG